MRDIERDVSQCCAEIASFPFTVWFNGRSRPQSVTAITPTLLSEQIVSSPKTEHWGHVVDVSCCISSLSRWFWGYEHRTEQLWVAAVLYSGCHGTKSFLRAKTVIQLVAISRHFVIPWGFIAVYVVLSLIPILRCGGSSMQWLPRSNVIHESTNQSFSW